MRLFDSYAVVDWSAASRPTLGRDSIWIGVSRDEHVTTENLATRAEAVKRLRSLARSELAEGRRLLIGFDFPFGYPSGVAAHIAGRPDALSLWRWIAARLNDGKTNANNRFEVAAEINRQYAGMGPFWGRPATIDQPDVPAAASARHGDDHPAERRAVELAVKGAKTVWQLAYAGAAGSQTLTGIPALLALREDPELSGHVGIWPFDTGLHTPDTAIVLAEVYPSLIPTDPGSAVRDEGQVVATTRWLATQDRTGRLPAHFLGPDGSDSARDRIASEEGWILGVETGDCRCTHPRALTYERDPAAIYASSFQTVRDEARLDHLPPDLSDVAIRLVHACGMPEITSRLAWSPNVAASAKAALAAGAPVLCDCEAVASMIVASRLPAANDVVCTLNAPETRSRAKRIANTRSAAAVELWRDRVEGSVVAIGNAPTALFHLLELIDLGWPRPAALLAFPVGFVGAAESKAELAARPRGIEFLTLRGRRGGSAMAAAAVNAMAAGLATPG